MASEEPMFDPSLKKKKKKKTVAFTEDPLGAEADPTTPHSPGPGGEPELGPTTIHEQSVQNGLADDDDEDKDDVKAMFGDLKKKKKKKELPSDLPDEGSPTPAAGDDLDFSDLKKKKKKKEIPLDLPEEGSGRSSPAPGATDDLDFSDIKKKKKKKEIPADLDDASGTATPAEGAGDDLDFSDLKKKKKKSKKSAFDMEAFEKELADTTTGSPKPPKDKDEEGEEGGEDEDLGEDVFAQHADAGAAPTGAVGSWIGTDRDYTYEDLLQRFYHRLHAGNPSLASSAGKRYTLAPPSIHREGNKKTIFANVTDICRRMHRQPEHVIQFLFAEMGTTGSVDGAGRLVIKGRFLQKQVENVLRRYIVEYVTCKTCKSPDTLLTKENRIYFMSCESCGSRRSVSAIKTGFQAQVAKRRLNKTG